MVQSLGYVPLTAGTPIRATANRATPTTRLGAQTVTVQAHPSNAGVVYVGLADMVTATGVGVLGVIPKPVSPTTGPFSEVTLSLPLSAAGLDASAIYLDGTTNDQAIVRITQG